MTPFDLKPRIQRGFFRFFVEFTLTHPPQKRLNRRYSEHLMSQQLKGSMYE